MTSVTGYASPPCYLHELETEAVTMKTCEVRIKRIYDPPARSDGWRVLVDRLWPRGVRKEEAHIDEWAKDLAPSPGLRQWFGHDPEHWSEFRRRYREELKACQPQIELLRERACEKPVTLLYAARDPQINHARVLRDVICASSARQAKRARA